MTCGKTKLLLKANQLGCIEDQSFTESFGQHGPSDILVNSLSVHAVMCPVCTTCTQGFTIVEVSLLQLCGAQMAACVNSSCCQVMRLFLIVAASLVVTTSADDATDELFKMQAELQKEVRSIPFMHKCSLHGSLHRAAEQASH
eukprot:2845515-Amphidinium_carterae.1